MSNQIVLCAPERLHTIIEDETRAGRRAPFAEAFLRLVALHAAYITQTDVANKQPRQGLISPRIEVRGERILREIDWDIIQNPRPNGCGGIYGERVLNGGLIQHSDMSWMNHT